MAENSSVQSVERTFDIIEALSPAPQGLTLLELASAVGLPKSTVHAFSPHWETGDILPRIRNPKNTS